MRMSDWSLDVFSSDLGVTRAESMTVFREHRLIDRREEHSRSLLNDTIIRRRDDQWAHFTIALGDIDPPHWTRAVTAFGQAFDQTVEPSQRHVVEGLSVHSRHHRLTITGQTVIRTTISPEGTPKTGEAGRTAYRGPR